MLKLRVIILSILCLFAASSAHADTVMYKKVNEDGTVVYSDTPFPGATKVIIKSQSSIIPSTPVPPPPPPQPQVKVKEKKHKLSVVSPMHESTIRDNAGNFRIISKLEPTLGGVYTLDMNGVTYESTTGIFEMKNMDRGEYTYKVTFSNKSGKVIASTDSRTLFLQRASVLFRNR